MVLWQSPDTPFLSWFLVFSLLSTCSVSCWSVVFGSRHSCLVSGSVLVRVGVRTLTSSLGPCPPLSVCIRCLRFVLFWVARSLCFSLAACFRVLSCFVWTRGLWVSLLAACSCPVLHMASDSVAGHVLWVLVCVSTWLSVLVSVCHVLSCQLSWLHPSCFCDYWLIYPTCVISLPSSFAPFIISLCLQSCVSLSLNVVCVMPCQSVFPSGVFFFVWFFTLLLIKPYFLQQLSPCSHPFHPPWQNMPGWNWCHIHLLERAIIILPIVTQIVILDIDFVKYLTDFTTIQQIQSLEKQNLCFSKMLHILKYLLWSNNVVRKKMLFNHLTSLKSKSSLRRSSCMYLHM